MDMRFEAGWACEKFFLRRAKRIDCVAAIENAMQDSLAEWTKYLAPVRIMGPALEHIHAERATAAGPGTPFDKDGAGHTLPGKWNHSQLP
jgi:hypothetical protein